MARDGNHSGGTYLCIDVSPRLLSSFPGSVFEHKYVTPFLQAPGLDALYLIPTIPWQKSVLAEMQKIGKLDREQGYGYEFDICASFGKKQE